MVFSSLVFLFLFLPICLFTYFVVGKRFRNPVLLLFSLIFYSWGEGRYVLLMLICIIVNFAYGRLLPYFKRKNQALACMILAVSLNLGCLVFFKYANFTVNNFNLLIQKLGLNPIDLSPVHLPIGISFFTFQAVSYVVDLYHEKTPAQKRVTGLGIYISLYPQLIAGPIIRYNDIANQIKSRIITIEDFAYGIRRFIIGLGKKVLIANNLAVTADDVFRIAPGDLTAPVAWLGIICYTFQIYFDFSGYSDMAIGIGRMLGFRFLENFNYPYISRSIQEFWRRWHISLSNWFRDYLYIPLGGNRQGGLRTLLNLYLVFFLCGLWHGASWNFVIWGLIHGTFLVMERIGLNKLLVKAGSLFGHIYVLLVVITAWVFFRANTLPLALDYLAAMFGFSSGNSELYPLKMFLFEENIFFFVCAVFASTPLLPQIKKMYSQSVKQSNGLLPIGMVAVIETTILLFLIAIFLFSTIYLAVGSYNPFIYFRF